MELQRLQETTAWLVIIGEDSTPCVPFVMTAALGVRFSIFECEPRTPIMPVLASLWRRVTPWSWKSSATSAVLCAPGVGGPILAVLSCSGVSGDSE